MGNTDNAGGDMVVQSIVKESFCVIGKEGSTREEDGWIQRLWADANARFEQVAQLAKTDENGKLVGIWGAMTDFSRSFLPWENGFSQGLYLAGVECRDGAQAPDGWTKWTIPGFEYLCTPNVQPETFENTIRYLRDRQIPLVGAVQEFTNPNTGEGYLWFPIRRL